MFGSRRYATSIMKEASLLKSIKATRESYNNICFFTEERGIKKAKFIWLKIKKSGIIKALFRVKGLKK